MIHIQSTYAQWNFGLGFHHIVWEKRRALNIHELNQKLMMPPTPLWIVVTNDAVEPICSCRSVIDQPDTTGAPLTAMQTLEVIWYIDSVHLYWKTTVEPKCSAVYSIDSNPLKRACVIKTDSTHALCSPSN